ncbi:MAG: HAD family hydrolase [bacterium]|nr:HAD family hydrolase [Gammaproteobacteria bacterium]HIL94425.1 HAD family hydrolase [Pseudomonadales bacterium]
MALAIFDLDETLISADSDHAWGEYAVDNNLVEAATYRQQNQTFYEDYQRGELDIDAYMRFSCALLASRTLDELLIHRRRFMNERIQPLLLPKAFELVESHKQKGDTLLVVTATIEFITQPIAQIMGIDNLIAPIPEQINGQFTGELDGIPSFRGGKVTRLNQWLAEQTIDEGLSMAGSYFYSDSANDLPLLQLVDHPVAVDPDPTLEEIALKNQWPVISLRG